jgi:hypothetical protein
LVGHVAGGELFEQASLDRSWLVARSADTRRRRAVADLPCSRPPGRARGGMRGAISGAVMAASPRGGPGRPGGMLASGLRVQVMSVLQGISPVWVSEGGLERPDRWYIPESGIHHQPKLPRQGPPGSAFRRRIAAAPPGPHDRFGYLTCGNDDRGQPGSSREVIRELRDAGQPWAGRRLGLCRQEMPCQRR